MRARILPVLLVPVLVAACGGSKSEPRLAQREFVDAANRVCVASDRRAFNLGNLSTDPKGWAKTARNAARGLRQMRAVRPPARKQAGFDRLLALGTQLQHQIQAVHDALAKKDYAGARAAQTRATATDTKIKLQARALGLTFCSQLLTNWPA